MYWDTKNIERLMFERVKSCAQTMDRGKTEWSQEFWCEVMGKVIANGMDEIKKRNEVKA